jgi:hypothetical protein
MYQDPVCGMSVDPEGAAGKSEYQGSTYYLALQDANASSIRIRISISTGEDTSRGTNRDSSCRFRKFWPS